LPDTVAAASSESVGLPMSRRIVNPFRLAPGLVIVTVVETPLVRIAGGSVWLPEKSRIVTATAFESVNGP
jgi:hypothetical protein